MSDNPKVSVIMPVYNAEQYLNECLDSILNQTLQDIEIICVDDGSTDNSLEILRKYATVNSNIKVLTQKNFGAGHARNVALSFAKGEYLSILDADDFFFPNMLEKAYLNAIKNDSEIVMFRHNHYDHQKKQTQELPNTMKKSKFPITDVFSMTDMTSNFYFAIFGWTWDKIFKRSFIKQHGLEFQNNRIYNDMFFTYSALVVANRVSYIDEVLMSKRVNLNGATSSSNTVTENWCFIFFALQAVKNYLLKSEKFERFKSDYMTYAIYIILHTFKKTKEFDRVFMKFFVNRYGLRILGLDLSKRSLFQREDELNVFIQTFLNVSFDELNFSNLKTNDSKLKEKEKVSCAEYDLAMVHKSVSFRIGRAITWLPRKIRGGVSCYREHGFNYTIKRLFYHLTKRH